MVPTHCFSLDPLETAKSAISEGIELPKPAPDGRINTLNNTGAMKLGNAFVITTSSFIEIASKPNTKVLDIGAAYGEACLEALKRGATDYTVNDIEEKHVKIFARRVYETFPSKINNIKLVVGGIPNDEFDTLFQKDSFDAILLDSILNFLNPTTIEKALHQIYSWLKPGGKVFALMGTYYVSTIREDVRVNFDKEFEELTKTSNISDASTFPGFMENISRYRNYDHCSKEDLEKKYHRNEAGSYFAFTKETATYFFKKSGFNIDECLYMPINTFPYKLDGREWIAVIAKKSEA